MSVLKREELESSPLADLHAIASELGLEGFRTKRKADLIAAILDATGEDADGDEATEDTSEDTSEGTSEDTSEGTSEDTSEGTSEDTSEGTSEDEESEEPQEKEPEREEELASGVLDILANGSGFVRVDPAGQSRDDVYVSPAQIRRCELRAGDEVSGPVRPPRRNERHPSLVRVATVNGADAEPPEERPWFGELSPVFPSARLPAPAALADVPFGRGSRVSISGPPGAGASTLLRELAAELGRDAELGALAVLAGVRPEELADWRAIEGVDAVGGSFDRSADAQAQAAELAIERAKRRVERGGHAVVLVDSLGALPAGARRRVFGAARATEEGGTLTVVAATGDAPEALRWATTRIVLEPGGRVGAESGALRADALT